MVKGVEFFLFSLITFSVDAHTCTCLWGPEVGVGGHPQWFPTLLLEMGVPQSSLEFADMASFTSHFG